MTVSKRTKYQPVLTSCGLAAGSGGTTNKVDGRWSMAVNTSDHRLTTQAPTFNCAQVGARRQRAGRRGCRRRAWDQCSGGNSLRNREAINDGQASSEVRVGPVTQVRTSSRTGLAFPQGRQVVSISASERYLPYRSPRATKCHAPGGREWLANSFRIRDRRSGVIRDRVGVSDGVISTQRNQPSRSPAGLKRAS